MEKEFDFTPTEDQFGVFWKYLMQPEVTGVNYSNGIVEAGIRYRMWLPISF